MANVNFPNSPTLNQSYLGENGVAYLWDGEKWRIYVDSDAAQANLWARNIGTATVYPSNAGDDVAVRDGTSTTTITLHEDGTVTALKFDIDALADLP